MAFLLVIHMLLAMGIVGLVLLQRSEGGALGIGGAGGGMGGLMAGRSAANLLTRATAVFAALFFSTSILLSILSGGGPGSGSILDAAPSEVPAADPSTATQEPVAAPEDGADVAPDPAPSLPGVPLDD